MAVVLVMAIALAGALGVLAAIAAAIEVLPSGPAPAAADPTDGDARPDPQADAYVNPVR